MLLFQPHVGVCLLLLLLPGCGTDSRSAETTLEYIHRTGVVRIAYANEYPFGYRDTKTGRVTGEAPEIATVVLKRMGIERIETSLVDFGQLIPGLQADRFDLIAAGMYITPVRCLQIDFSNPTYCVGEAFLVPKDNPHDLHSFEDVGDKTDVKLGVISGTVELTIAEHLGIPDKRIVIFPDNAMALAGLRIGRIDAFAATQLTVDGMLRRLAERGFTDLKSADPFRQPQMAGRTKNCGAFGFRKGDGEFRHQFNRQLAKLVGTEAHLKLVSQWRFGEKHMPGDILANELCSPLKKAQ